MDFIAAEKFIQLGRRHWRAGKHCVHLPAVMDLMLEQVGEDAPNLVRIDAGYARYLHRSIESGVIEFQAKGDQTRIGFALLACELRAIVERFFRIEKLA